MKTTTIFVLLFAVLVAVSADRSLRETGAKALVDGDTLKNEVGETTQQEVGVGKKTEEETTGVDGPVSEDRDDDVGAAKVDAMKRRLIEIWGAALAIAINENFAYHGLAHNINFAEAAQQQAKLLTSRMEEHNLDAFFGGLLHDAGYYRSVEHAGYEPICLKSGDSYVFSPFVTADHMRSGNAEMNGLHVKSNIGHEELSICWMLKLVYQLKKEAKKENPSEVDVELLEFFTPSRVRDLIAAIMHTKFGMCTKANAPTCPPPEDADPNAFMWKYVKSPRIEQDIRELAYGGELPRTKDFPNGLECNIGDDVNLFPIANWLEEDGPGRLMPRTAKGDENLNKIFMNADFVQMAQQRSLCTSMSLLHEIMAYEGQHTFLPFPSTKNIFEKVFVYLLGDVPGPEVALDREDLRFGKYNGYAGNVLAFLAGQDFFVETIVQYERFNEREVDLNELVAEWTTKKNSSVQRGKIFSKVAYEFLKLKFTSIAPFDIFHEQVWPILKAGNKGVDSRDAAIVDGILCQGKKCAHTSNSNLSKENFDKILAEVSCVFGNVPKVMVDESTLSDWSGRYFGPEDRVADEIPLTDSIRRMLSPKATTQCDMPESSEDTTTEDDTRLLRKTLPPLSHAPSLQHTKDTSTGVSHLTDPPRRKTLSPLSHVPELQPTDPEDTSTSHLSSHISEPTPSRHTLPPLPPSSSLKGMPPGKKPESTISRLPHNHLPPLDTEIKDESSK